MCVQAFSRAPLPVCLQKYLQQLWDTVLLVALILSTGVIVQARWQYQDHRLNDDLEVLEFMFGYIQCLSNLLDPPDHLLPETIQHMNADSFIFSELSAFYCFEQD